MDIRLGDISLTLEQLDRAYAVLQQPKTVTVDGIELRAVDVECMHAIVHAQLDGYVMSLESRGAIGPDCPTCLREIYPKLGQGKELWEIFCPPHKPSTRCKSGGHAHCTCDTCF